MATLKAIVDFFKDISHFFRFVLLAWWAAFLFPAGVMTAIVMGGWLYLLPFVTANILISYKLNIARKAQGLREFDDKAFTKYEKSLDRYIELTKKSKENKTVI